MSYRRKLAERLVKQNGSCFGISCTSTEKSTTRKKDRCPCCAATEECAAGLYLYPIKEAQGRALRIAAEWLEKHPKKSHDEGQEANDEVQESHEEVQEAHEEVQEAHEEGQSSKEET
jgi:hypothetical protein